MNEVADLDSRIMLQVAKGDLEPLGGLFVRYEKRLFGFFCRSLGDRDTAADLVQNTFFRVMRSRGTFKAKGHFSGWLFQIARSVVADHLRSRKPEQPLNLELLEESQVQADPEDSLTLSQALDRLDDVNRDILLMSRFSGMTYAEIGAATGLTAGAVKLRVFRSLTQLKSHVSEPAQAHGHLEGKDYESI